MLAKKLIGLTLLIAFFLFSPSAFGATDYQLTYLLNALGKTEANHTYSLAEPCVGVTTSGNYIHQSGSLYALTFPLPDTIPPQGTIKINNDAQYTNSTSVTLTLSATDTESGMGQGSQMQFSNDNTNWSTPEAYATTKAWTLTSGDGEKIVSVKFKDVAGNWSGAISDTIILSTVPTTITVIEVNPVLGVVVVGSTTVSSTPVNITNNSSVKETYSLNLTNPPGWTASQTAAGAETYVLNAAFDEDGTGINWNEANHALSTTPVNCSATKFAADKSGVKVSPNETRKLWFQFKAPTSTQVTTEKSITITITAKADF